MSNVSKPKEPLSDSAKALAAITIAIALNLLLHWWMLPKWASDGLPIVKALIAFFIIGYAVSKCWEVDKKYLNRFIFVGIVIFYVLPSFCHYRIIESMIEKYPQLTQTNEIARLVDHEGACGYVKLMGRGQAQFDADDVPEDVEPSDIFNFVIKLIDVMISYLFNLLGIPGYGYVSYILYFIVYLITIGFGAGFRG